MGRYILLTNGNGKETVHTCPVPLTLRHRAPRVRASCVLPRAPPRARAGRRNPGTVAHARCTVHLHLCRRCGLTSERRSENERPCMEPPPGRRRTHCISLSSNDPDRFFTHFSHAGRGPSPKKVLIFFALLVLLLSSIMSTKLL